MVEKISKPGLYSIPLQEYHGQPCDGPSFTRSTLHSALAECPAMAWATSPLNPERVAPSQTDAQIDGQIAHAFVLGDESFEREFIISPYDAFRSNDARAWRDRQTKKVVKEKDLDRARAMRDAARADQDVGYCFSTPHKVEQTIAWKDADTGIWLLSRLDQAPENPTDLLRDFKTAASIHPDKLQYAWFDYGYDMQAAMALDGWHAVTGERRPGFAHICQRSRPPYLCALMVFDDRQIEMGRIRYKKALEIVAECLETGRWPKYHEGPAYYRTPAKAEYFMEDLTGDTFKQSGGDGAGKISYADALAAG